MPKTRRLVRSAARLPLLLACALPVAACSPPYLIHLGIGQSRIMLARRDYSDILKDPSLGARVKSLMLVVQETKRFSEEEIGLARTDNFDSYVNLNREAVSWTVVASEKTRLEAYRWWFPIVGRVPYKGYFSRERARAEARHLAGKGYDTHVSDVTAYSTLGYFADPVFSTFLRYSESAIPELILHELTHATLFIKGEADFNEGLATFVGHKGGLAFLERRYGPGSSMLRDAQARFRDEIAFGGFVAALCERLEALYDGALSESLKLARREEIFKEEKRAFAELQKRFSVNKYDGFTRNEWNNAFIMAHRRYHGDLPEFEKLYMNLGGDLREFVAFFREVEERGENPLEALRRGAAAIPGTDGSRGEEP